MVSIIAEGLYSSTWSALPALDVTYTCGLDTTQVLAVTLPAGWSTTHTAPTKIRAGEVCVAVGDVSETDDGCVLSGSYYDPTHYETQYTPSDLSGTTVSGILSSLSGITTTGGSSRGVDKDGLSAGNALDIACQLANNVDAKQVYTYSTLSGDVIRIGTPWTGNTAGAYTAQTVAVKPRKYDSCHCYKTAAIAERRKVLVTSKSQPLPADYDPEDPPQMVQVWSDNHNFDGEKWSTYPALGTGVSPKWGLKQKLNCVQYVGGYDGSNQHIYIMFDIPVSTSTYWTNKLYFNYNPDYISGYEHYRYGCGSESNRVLVIEGYLLAAPPYDPYMPDPVEHTIGSISSALCWPYRRNTDTGVIYNLEMYANLSWGIQAWDVRTGVEELGYQWYKHFVESCQTVEVTDPLTEPDLDNIKWIPYLDDEPSEVLQNSYAIDSDKANIARYIWNNYCNIRERIEGSTLSFLPVKISIEDKYLYTRYDSSGHFLQATCLNLLYDGASRYYNEHNGVGYKYPGNEITIRLSTVQDYARYWYLRGTVTSGGSGSEWISYDMVDGNPVPYFRIPSITYAKNTAFAPNDAYDSSDPKYSYNGPYKDMVEGQSRFVGTASTAKMEATWPDIPEFEPGSTRDELELTNATYGSTIISQGMYGTQIIPLTADDAGTVSLTSVQGTTPMEVEAICPASETYDWGDTPGANPLGVSSSLWTSKAETSASDLLAMANTKDGTITETYTSPLSAYSTWASLFAVTFGGRTPCAMTLSTRTETVTYTIKRAS